MTAMVHIDVGEILQQSANGVYTDLVTRATGRTVRTRIEQHIAAGRPGTLAVIDFTNVGLLDFSCADEIVASLVRQYCLTATASHERYFLFSGISDDQLDAIEYVAERQRMALVLRITAGGSYRLVGMVDEVERAVWEAVVRCQPADVCSIAVETGLDEVDVEPRLAKLHQRRLIMRDGAVFRAPTGAVA